MNRPPPANLHPVWYRHFGFDPAVTSQPDTSAKTANPTATAKPASLRPRSAAENDGWEPTCSYRPPYGTPVGIRRRLGQSIWENTVVLPGDSRYPWPDHTPESNR